MPIHSPEEAQALLSDLLISVTTFFRDHEAFDALTRQVVPKLFDEKKELEDVVRVWIAGCATGEEAYTVAILLLEEASRRQNRPTVQIFASDLDSAALAIAREGCYPAAIEADVTEERLRRFFTREGDHYVVKRELRDVVLFANHSILKDPPFSHLDLVSCRNLLIYLDRELQEQACATIHYALNPNGFLLLGASESADYPTGAFRAIDRKARIFQSISTVNPKPRLLPKLLGALSARDKLPQFTRSFAATTFDAASHRHALESLAPPSVIVDETYRIVHVSETAGRYLQQPGGSPTIDVTELARPELRFDLRIALHRAFEQGISTLTLPIPIQFNGAPHRVYLQIKPVLLDDETAPRQALIMFIEGEAFDALAAPGEPSAERTTNNDNLVRQLTIELQATQSRLRAMREESETANEELRAANEELQSINEEYRSTSEELETSKEELQSINEELQTVNSELKLKLEFVSRAHSDLQNLTAATDVGTLFLDSTLRIRRFTPRVTELFSITQGDEGRPITDFAHQLDYGGLVDDVRKVIDDLIPVVCEIQSRQKRWYELRLRPYRTIDDRIDGVVISLIEITERREAEDRLKREQQLVELSAEPIFVWDFDDGIIQWNRGCEQLYGYARAEVLGERKDALLKTVVPGSTFDALKRELLETGSWRGELQHTTKGGNILTVESRIDLAHIDNHHLVLETTRNVTERKEWERRQQLLLAELTHRVKNTLAVVQSMAHQTYRTSEDPDDFLARFDGRLAALAGTHSLLVESNWKGAELGALARQQLRPYLTSVGASRILIEGEPLVLLSPEVATPFGLVLHELATNAVKYGSLSRPSGTVALRWELTGSDSLRQIKIVWHESGGPEVHTPKRSGFGFSLIRGAIPNAKVHHELHKDGVVCTIELSLPGEGPTHERAA